MYDIQLINASFNSLFHEDFYADSYAREIDTLSGFALIASVQSCFVWQHAQVHQSIHLTSYGFKSVT